MSDYMELAREEAYFGIRHGHGGPFGAVIVKDGRVIAAGHNRVLDRKDPTCHGEMEAIRAASAKLGTFDLSGCELYTTAEPCPMCLGAILWSNIKKVYYGCNRSDTEKIGFRDAAFYEYLEGRRDMIEQQETEREECLKLFKEYSGLEKEIY